MPVSPSPLEHPVRSLDAVESLLRDLGPQLRRGEAVRETCDRFSPLPFSQLPTGIEALDDLLGGGLPRGRLSEISGPSSSGGTSLALALLANATGRGEVVGVVDAADAFDPASALAVGVELEGVLWARPPGLREALRCAERLLHAEGFALVLLDLPRTGQPIPPATWPRLTRGAASTHTALVLLSDERRAGASVDVALELSPATACFSAEPALLEGLEIEVALVRSRSRPLGRCSANVRLHTRAA